jgi:hypothetical protein
MNEPKKDVPDCCSLPRGTPHYARRPETGTRNLYNTLSQHNEPSPAQPHCTFTAVVRERWLLSHHVAHHCTALLGPSCSQHGSRDPLSGLTRRRVLVGGVFFTPTAPPSLSKQAHIGRNSVSGNVCKELRRREGPKESLQRQKPYELLHRVWNALSKSVLINNVPHLLAALPDFCPASSLRRISSSDVSMVYWSSARRFRVLNNSTRRNK